MTEGKGRIGTSFDGFLEQEGRPEEVTAAAIKRLLTRQIVEAMEAGQASKSKMARRMNTSRSQLDHLLDLDNTKIQLDTLYKAALAVEREVRLELV